MSSRIKEIYLIRHGETAYNRLGVVQGSGIDADLNDLGVAQAQAFFEAYQHVTFQKIYVSELKRTFQSVQSFIQTGIPYEKHHGLNEISWGIKEGTKPDLAADDEHSKMIAGWQMGHTYLASPGGESPQQVAERQQLAMQRILSQDQEDLILIAMHGRAMRILLTQLLKKPLSDMDDFQHSNLCLYHLQYAYDSQSFTLVRANDTQHLVKLTV